MKHLNLIITLLCLLVFFTVKVPPYVFWPLGLISLGVPFAFLALVSLLIFWLNKGNVIQASLPFLGLLYSLKFLPSFVAMNPAGAEPHKLKVLSFNVQVFNQYAHLADSGYMSSLGIRNFNAEHDADVKCFQEFYNDNKSDTFNTIDVISRRGEYEYHYAPTPVYFSSLDEQKSFGLIIFSRFPIVNRGEILFGQNLPNKGVFADVKVGEDTVRIINVHLQSMSINEQNLLQSDTEGALEEYRNIARRLKRGFENRSHQIEVIRNFAQNSPYKVIVCGDYNEVPFSFAYRTMRQHFKNAFEEGGRGFGFSYNGILFFLRIDNMFYSPEMKIINFRTRRDMLHSDHFPIEGSFTW